MKLPRWLHWPLLSSRLRLPLIIAILVVMGILILLKFGSQIWQWLIENSLLILQIFFGALLSSIVAAWLYSYLFEKQVWEKDIQPLKDSVSKLSIELEKLKSDYASLMSRLPNAIGGKFNESLFGYYPETSKELAKILSKQTEEWYMRHYKRVLVDNADDIYKLRQVHEIKNGCKDQKPMLVWEFTFQSTWEWVNDSKVSKYPLENFMIIVSSPDEDVESILDGKTPQELEDQRRKFFEFIRKQNIVRSIVPIILPFNPDTIDELFSVDEITIYIDDIPKIFTLDELDKLVNINDIKKKLGVVGVFRVYRLKEKDAAISLEPGKRIRINYQGRISLPVYVQDGKRYGQFNFPPSDIIASRYTMTLIYPKTIQVQGQNISLKIQKGECGNWFVYERRDYTLGEDTHSIATRLPKELRPGNEEDAVQLVVKEPLTDLNRISMVWIEA